MYLYIYVTKIFILYLQYSTYVCRIMYVEIKLKLDIMYLKKKNREL